MFALLTILALLVAACGGSTASPSASASAAAGKADYKACLSLDTGGPTDKNFNQSAYEGLQTLEKEGFKTAYTTAVDDSSYAPNIQQLIDQGCNTVIAVGYNQGTALVAAVKDVANA
jgi:basic membrane protein A